MYSRFGMLGLSVIPLLILTLIIVAGMHAIVTAITRPRRGAKAPCCEKCRYPVAGLTTFACPECGADFRTTGIITPPMEMRRRGSAFGAIVWLTVLCFLLMWIGMYTLIMFFGVWGATATNAGVPVASTSLTPSSTAYKSITLEQHNGTMAPIVAILNLTDGTTRRLEIHTVVNPPNAVLKDADGVEFASAAFDETMPARLFTHAGININDPAIAIELADLTRIIDAGIAAPWNPPTSTRVRGLTIGATTYAGGAAATPVIGGEPTYALLALVIPLLIWVGGIVLILSRRRRLLRDAARAEQVLPTMAAPGGAPC